LASERVERRLTAILAADVAGYSRLTSIDEEGTHAQLKAHLTVLVDPKVAEHRGHVVKHTGDGILAEFSSVVDAMRCAIDVQRGMCNRNTDVPPETRIEFRIGINVGDIISNGGDIFGDGVNLAVRLEGVAEPGGICVSDRVREYTESLDISFEDAGQQQLKNIARPVRVYRVALGSNRQKETPALRVPSRPSIAVLAFENLSGDHEQEYFADGIVEDIILELSRIRWLFVIARNSSFTYKGHPVDVKQVGRELGVRYVLEGSVRKAGRRVRITGQLIEASSGVHLWADRFEGAVEDVFDLQDQVASSVAGAIAPQLEQAEIERAKRKPTDSLDAYDYYLRGVSKFHKGSRTAINEALGLFYRAIQLDADFASAYAMAAWCYVPRKWRGFMVDRTQEIAEAAHLARRGALLGRTDAVALCAGGFALAHVVGELDEGAALIDRALVLNPNLAAAWHNSGWVRVWLGEPELAIEHFAQAMRLSPLDSLLFGMQTGIAFAHFFAGRYREASSWAEKAVREQPNWATGILIAGASRALSGQQDEACKVMARARQLNPAFCIANLRDLLPLRRPEDVARCSEGLRKAGLPEH
jgi:TolB-like protein